MKNTLFILVGIAVIIGAGFWYLNKAQSDKEMAIPKAAEPAQKIVEVSVANRTLTPNVVTVNESDAVTIRVTTDEAGEFHISGYEIENDMEVGSVLEFSFVADKPGRYNFELHPKEDDTQALRLIPVAKASEPEEGEAEEDIVIGAFVVNPK